MQVVVTEINEAFSLFEGFHNLEWLTVIQMNDYNIMINYYNYVTLYKVVWNNKLINLFCDSLPVLIIFKHVFV